MSYHKNQQKVVLQSSAIRSFKVRRAFFLILGTSNFHTEFVKEFLLCLHVKCLKMCHMIYDKNRILFKSNERFINIKGRYKAPSHRREKCLLASSYLSVRLSTRINAAPTKPISAKFHIGNFYELQSRKPNFFSNRAKISDILHEVINSFLLPATQICHKSLIVQHSVLYTVEE